LDETANDKKLAPPEGPLKLFPNGDALDRKIISLALPAILNLMIIPLVGIVDFFWVALHKKPKPVLKQIYFFYSPNLPKANFRRFRE
jgi:hypothetical protein